MAVDELDICIPTSFIPWVYQYQSIRIEIVHLLPASHTRIHSLPPTTHPNPSLSFQYMSRITTS